MFCPSECIIHEADLKHLPVITNLFILFPCRLKFYPVKKTDAGYYSCGSEYGEWSNLTLSVISQHEASDHYQNDSPGSGLGPASPPRTRVANLEKKSLLPPQPKPSPSPAPLDVVENDLLDSSFKVSSQGGSTVTITKKVDENYKVRCNGTVEPSSQISWIKDGEVVPTTKNRPTLALHTLMPEDAGVYVCRVCNAQGCVNSTTILEVIDDPEDSDRYNDMEVHSQVSDNEDPDDPDYVDDEQDDYEDAEEDEEVDEEIINAGLQPGSADGEFTESQSAPPRPNGQLPPGPPVFTKEEHMVKLMPKPSGNMVRLRCPADGNPVPNITWTKDNEKIVRSMGSVKYAKWSIVLEDLVPKDSGKYTCHVCNGHGCIDFTTQLEVKGELSGVMGVFHKLVFDES